MKKIPRPAKRSNRFFQRLDRNSLFAPGHFLPLMLDDFVENRAHGKSARGPYNAAPRPNAAAM
jgi:hypothetical protein